MPEIAKQITVKRTGNPMSYEILIDAG